ncbi:hypothetical protein THAOC_17075 [Thalassiosira oceanica]|uniref:Uncharacterized protein n=1 Tax=Thalassiosira oceanica TaxID=159749 RepID=K0SVR2_THAOC|nr:hypothetical protein THAOC_17075 [Thalassiosira oceanica]|mmetsp:Transcript_1217/g.2612  ORF Transcript_1217/g.2612 Transcript_1217/m.2612 type:complete len:189 (-) Transcript_1217:170-736(-)|eukprot:EJK62317.1 hypothetical protein THAOC_17075 [Thalassiosira oceanica]
MAPRLEALDPCHDDYNPRRHVDFPSAVVEEPLESPLFRDASSVKLSSLDRRVSDPDFQALGEAARKVDSREDGTTTSSERSSGSGRSQPKPSRIAELIGSEKGKVLVPQSTIAAAAKSSIRGEDATPEKKSSDEENATSRPKAKTKKAASRSIKRKVRKILKSIPKRIKKTLNDMKYPTNEPVPAHVI